MSGWIVYTQPCLIRYYTFKVKDYEIAFTLCKKDKHFWYTRFSKDGKVKLRDCGRDMNIKEMIFSKIAQLDMS